jgi:hypothetical protein
MKMEKRKDRTGYDVHVGKGKAIDRLRDAEITTRKPEKTSAVISSRSFVERMR